MSDKTKIEWTDASWNPVTGCTKVSEGCDHCYAETIATRFAGTKAYPDGFKVTLRPDKLDQPLRWQRPRRIFVNSMSDLFHDDVPDEFIARVFAVMALASQHTFQVLTKRPGRMRSLLNDREFWNLVAYTAGHEFALVERNERLVPRAGLDVSFLDAITAGRPLPNVWLGVSVESQKWAYVRIPQLLDTPAAVRFLSCEPLLGRVDLAAWIHGTGPNPDDGPMTLLDWVIVGGESGPHAQPMHPEWARSLRDQCHEAGVAFLFKQWGEWAPMFDGTTALHFPGPSVTNLAPDGELARDGVPGEPMIRVGKKSAGRELDGRTWDEYPEVNP